MKTLNINAKLIFDNIVEHATDILDLTGKVNAGLIGIQLLLTPFIGSWKVSNDMSAKISNEYFYSMIFFFIFAIVLGIFFQTMAQAKKQRNDEKYKQAAKVGLLIASIEYLVVILFVIHSIVK